MELIALLLGMAWGVYLFIRGLVLLSARHAIADLPLCKADAAAMGPVALAGMAKAITLIKAPYSAQDCVCCHYKREVPAGDGWTTVEEGTSGGLFYLQDDSGEILVDATGAECSGAPTYQGSKVDTGSDSNPLTSDASIDEITAGKEGAKLPGSDAYPVDDLSQVEDSAFKPAHRLTEIAILEGQAIYVQGMCWRTQPGADGSGKDQIIVSRAGGKMVLSTSTRDELIASAGGGYLRYLLLGAGVLLVCLWYLLAHFQFTDSS